MRGFSPLWAPGMRTGMCHPWLAVAQGAGGAGSFPNWDAAGKQLEEGEGFPASLDSSVSL